MNIIYYCDQETHIATNGITIFWNMLYLYQCNKYLWRISSFSVLFEKKISEPYCETNSTFHKASRPGLLKTEWVSEAHCMPSPRILKNVLSLHYIRNGFVIHVRWHVYSVRYSGRLTLIWIIEWCTIGVS